MLHYFPEIRLEELFLSIVARYGQHLRLWQRHQVQEQLFGRGNIVVGVETPRALDALVGRLPIGMQITVEDLIDNHTLLPIYLPFIPPADRDFAKQAMRGDCVRDVLAIVGRNVKIQPPDWLRFCPVCWKEDHRLFGEPYWRRLHQALGVEVCVDHHVFLEESNAPRSLPLSRYALPTAKIHCQDMQPRKVIASDQDHLARLKIAQDVNWLLSNNRYYPDAEVLRCHYSEMLFEKGLAKSLCKLDYPRLRSAVCDQFSDEILQQWGCSPTEDNKCRWVMNLTRKQSDTVSHPLHHLVLIHTLGFTAKSFFSSLLDTPTKFGKGPWPCNNIICPSHKKFTIVKPVTKYCANGKKIVGIFTCPECRQAYRGSGVINSMLNPFIIGRCCDRGDLWRNELVNLWSDKNKTIAQIQEALNCSDAELVSQLATMGLSSRNNKEEGKSKHITEVALARSQLQVKHRETMRSCWLKLRAQNPQLGIKQLQMLESNAHDWLMKKDRIWLLANRPPVRRRGRIMGDKYPLEDWVSRDREYTIQVNLAVAKLRSQLGRPVLISKSAICRAISFSYAGSTSTQRPLSAVNSSVLPIKPLRPSQLTNKEVLKNLPTTSATLSRLVESAVDFARRRLLWAAEEYSKDAVLFTKYQLVAKAGVRTLTDKDRHRPESVTLNALADELCSRRASSLYEGTLE